MAQDTDTGYTSNKDYDTYQWKNTVQAENVDFRNCVMYNAQGTCYGGPGHGERSIGPSSGSQMIILCLIGASR